MPNYLLEFINAVYVRRPNLKAKENIKQVLEAWIEKLEGSISSKEDEQE